MNERELYSEHFVERVTTVLRWRKAVARGEMIQQPPHWCKTHMGFRSRISQKDLDDICLVVNYTFEKAGSKLAVTNSMGEIRPAERIEQ